MSKLVVIALGGNALQLNDEEPTYENQRKNIKEATANIVELVANGYQVVITHGNGPQVGRLLMQQANGQTDDTPQLPFDAVDAMSQATIGYQIEQVLQNEFARRNINKSVSTIITQVVVDEKDPGFENPTKPIGPFYTADQAEELSSETGDVYKQDSGRGYRRVVASPDPQKIVELNTIKSLVANGEIVICCGGGGIPVIEKENIYTGTAAVIDKDKATNLLAKKLDADYLVILTAVREAAINYGEANEEWLQQVKVSEIQTYAEEGHFAPGSMLPKVEASIDFAVSTGNQAIITTIDSAYEAITTGQVGTIISN